LELYSQISNRCYLANVNAEFLADLRREYENLTREISRNLRAGFIAELYAPANDDKILPGERAFYTRKNAVFIDTARELIAKMSADLQPFFIAPLLYEASNRANTSGVFKGFYKNKQGVGQFGGEGKNALKRITSEISLPFPVFSAFKAPFEVYRRDANELARELDGVDLVYLDPPYNQHPYGSNYFMLNLIASYERPSEISAVSGIAKDWNRSAYNQKSRAAEAFFELVSRLKTKFALISYNCEGFISRTQFEENLAKFGRTKILEQRYNAFRGSRNLSKRNTHVTEFLYVLKKH
jgi:D12 class N6 adenine-specific DNA methyltransferase